MTQNIKLADTVREIHSGLTGTVIAEARYLYSEPALLVAIKHAGVKKIIADQWFSLSRLKKIKTKGK